MISDWGWENGNYGKKVYASNSVIFRNLYFGMLNVWLNTLHKYVNLFGIQFVPEF